MQRGGECSGVSGDQGSFASACRGSDLGSKIVAAEVESGSGAGTRLHRLDHVGDLLLLSRCIHTTTMPMPDSLKNAISTTQARVETLREFS